MVMVEVVVLVGIVVNSCIVIPLAAHSSHIRGYFHE